MNPAIAYSTYKAGKSQKGGWAGILRELNRPVIIITIVLIVALIIFLIIRKKRKENTKSLISRVFGNDSKELKEATEALSQSTAFQQAIEANATISRNTASSLAKKIKNAWGTVNDDEEAVYAALKKLNNKADWLLLVQEYGVNSAAFKDRDLEGDLEYRLSEDEFAVVQSILKSKGVSI